MSKNQVQEASFSKNLPSSLQDGLQNNSQNKVVVYGDSVAAALAVKMLLADKNTSEYSIFWVSGSGSKVLPVMPSLKSEAAIQVIESCRASDSGHLYESVHGIQHRVYKNKSFKLDTKLNHQELWKPEQMWVTKDEHQLLGLDLVKVEEDLKKELLLEGRVTRIENAEILEFEALEKGGKLQLVNQQQLEFVQFIYADTVAHLRSYPKLWNLFKAQVRSVKTSEMVSVLQVVFHHTQPLLQKIQAGLMIPLSKESGETIDRHVMGYFLEDQRSVWTVFLQGDEAEENHDVMKKLRKIKQCLNKVFEGAEFLPEGVSNFMSTVAKEQVKFELNYFCATEVQSTETLARDFVFASDSFGLTYALEQLSHGVDVETPVEQVWTQGSIESQSQTAGVSPS